MMGDGTVIFSNSPANETAAFNFQKAKCRVSLFLDCHKNLEHEFDFYYIPHSIFIYPAGDCTAKKGLFAGKTNSIIY
jgi:hypothetical protein